MSSVLITGGNGSIGLACARLFLQRWTGAKVYLDCRVARARAEHLAAEFAGRCELVTLEVTDAAAKAGVLALSQSPAKEVARAGVTVNAICPGYVMTAALAQDAAQVAGLAIRVPARRLGRPEEVAAAVLYLAGADAAYTTGAVLKLDGGIY